MREPVCSIKYEDAILKAKWTHNILLFWTFLQAFKANTKVSQRHLSVYLLKMSFAGKNPPWARPAGDGKWKNLRHHQHNTLSVTVFESCVKIENSRAFACACCILWFVQLWKFVVNGDCTNLVNRWSEEDARIASVQFCHSLVSQGQRILVEAFRPIIRFRARALLFTVELVCIGVS